MPITLEEDCSMTQTQPTEPPRVALYARASTDDAQAQERQSIPTQLAGMRAYAQARGWIISAEFTDPDHPGTAPDRPGLSAALDGAQQGAFDILLIHEPSRLSRRPSDASAALEQLRQHRVDLVPVSVIDDAGASLPS
jgi:DNA invertase Pin-like site-specific DNA recombinase